MENGIYLVYDKVAEHYHAPMYQLNDGVAMRMFRDACMDVDTKIGMHPEDFSLWKGGLWNAQTGAFEIYEDYKKFMAGS